MPDIIPMIAYQDGVAALYWLAEAFGFEEKTRMLNSDGTLAHGEMSMGDGLIMLAMPTPAYESPKNHRLHCDRADSWLQAPWVIDGALVYVDDIDSHFRQAKEAGATILSEIEDGPPGRRYRVEDFEGHRWMFMQRG